MSLIKNTIRRAIKSLGYDIVPNKTASVSVENSPFQQICKFIDVGSPTILDVGANVGQSTLHFKEVLPDSTVHSFEPSPTTFKKLEENCRALSGIHLWNNAVGSRQGALLLHENTYSDMTSFLKPSEFCWGDVKSTVSVDTVTLDNFTERENIPFVEVLKCDTQGYDLEVFKGCHELMRNNRIGLIYCEVIYTNMYEGLPPFYEVFKFLVENNFKVVNIYEQNHQSSLLSWSDVLFINYEYYKKFLKRITE